MQDSILLVDDEPNVISSLKRALLDEPYEIYSAGGGADGLKLLDQRQIKVIISDERMPGMTGAEFLITGEVLGQRPMSQRRDALDIIDRETGLRGLVLRPLSAKLMKPTVREEKGIVNRDLLYDFSGRSRKPQMALAREFGLTDYPAPAGGCLLTEPNYSFRLRELLDHDADPAIEDLSFLRLGRHFRMSESCKIIVGRNKDENEALIALDSGKSISLSVESHASPIVLVRGKATEEIILTAASLCARYSDARHLNEIDVKVVDNIRVFTLSVTPAGEDIIEQYKIEKKEKNRPLIRV